MNAADLNILAEILITLGKIGLENENIKEIDINPLILSGGKPIAVDALIVLEAWLLFHQLTDLPESYMKFHIILFLIVSEI